MKPRTLEHSRKIGEAQLGKKISDECKVKMSLAQKGKRKPEAHRLNIIKGLAGRIVSEETRNKIREKLLGHKLSEVTKDKISKQVIENNGNSPKRRGQGQIDRGKFKYSSEGVLWHTSVFSRDNFTCKKCNVTGRELHAHHIFSFSSHVELRTSICNGITLCKKCHISFHNTYGRQNNTNTQILGWIEDA